MYTHIWASIDILSGVDAFRAVHGRQGATREGRLGLVVRSRGGSAEATDGLAAMSRSAESSSCELTPTPSMLGSSGLAGRVPGVVCRPPLCRHDAERGGRASRARASWRRVSRWRVSAASSHECCGVARCAPPLCAAASMILQPLALEPAASLLARSSSWKRDGLVRVRWVGVASTA